MKVILLRHAEAEEFDPLRHADDSQRPLTKAGIKLQCKLAGALRRMGLKPARVFTSPRLRARHTADITAAALGLEQELRESPVLGDGYSGAALFKLLAECGEDETVLCVGHEPDLSEFFVAAVSDGGSINIKFVKSGVLGIKFDGKPKPGTGKLIYFYRPQELIALS